MRYLAGLLLLLANVCALASPSGVVISQFQIRGPAGGNDEFIEIQNRGTANVAIGGWTLRSCASGSGNLTTRATVAAGVVLRPGQYYLFANNASSGGYSGSVPPDATYGTGVTDFGSGAQGSGMAIHNAAGAKQDGVGAAGTANNLCREGTGIATTPTGNSNNNAFVRIADTDNNATDFAGPRAAEPHNAAGLTAGCVASDVRIFTIQGRGHVSPYAGKLLCNTPGIVTQLSSNGFTMQDGDGDGDPATSDGIFVFTGSAPTVSVGQQVLVKGTITEFRSGSANLTLTEIGGTPTVTVASGLFTNTTITPVVVGLGGRVPPNEWIDRDTTGSVEVATQTTYTPDTDGIDFWESLEGMVVTMNGARATGPSNSFGEVWMVGDNGAAATGVNARGGITLIDHGSYVDFNPERIVVDLGFLPGAPPMLNVGDRLSAVTGVLTFAFGTFRINPSVQPTVVATGPARTRSTVTKHIERLRIASYNVENLDVNDGDTCDGAPDRDVADGRFTREAQQIVEALGSPDVLGIEELQDNSGCANDGTVSASATLAMLADAIVAAGGPRYSWVVVDPVNNADGGAPGANIRQAILYDASVVAHVPGTSGAGDASTATSLSKDAQGRLQLSHSPGRIEPANSAWRNSRKPLAATFDFNGRRVLVIVNHFNSKGGDEPLYGRFQPPLEDSEPQRVAQAQVEHDFIEKALKLVPDARIVTLGDFNDFEFAQSMRTLTGAASGTPILVDLATALLPAEERYSYVFEGNSQELDHIFVSSALLADAEFQAVHVNAEYADQVSDHDPIIASLRILPPPPVADAGADQNVAHLTTATLDGRGSRAGDGTALTYAWTQTAGEPVTLSAPNAAVTTFTTPAQPTVANANASENAPQALEFKLTVTDRFGNVATDTVIVKVRPGKPGN